LGRCHFVRIMSPWRALPLFGRVIG
jgi:hypothetical protein